MVGYWIVNCKIFGRVRSRPNLRFPDTTEKVHEKFSSAERSAIEIGNK